MKKRIIAFLSAVLMVIGIIPAPALATDSSVTVSTSVCNACGNEVCSCESTSETMESTVDNCAYCEETTAEDGTVVHADGCNAAYAYDGTADVGKYVQMNPNAAELSVSVSDGVDFYSPLIFDYTDFDEDLVMKVKDWYWDAELTGLWYQVDAYSGSFPESTADFTWPETAWIMQNYTDPAFAGIDSLVFIEIEQEEESRNISGVSESGKAVNVMGNIPDEVSLSVTDVTEIGAEFPVTGTVLAALDICPQYADGSEWQPNEGCPVTVELNAASLGLSDGDIVKLHHKHGTTVETYDVYVVIDGKITFLTDSFSIYLVEEEFDTETSTGAAQIASGSTYYMTVGESSQVFYTSGSDDTFPATTTANGYTYTNYKYYVWSVTDENGAIEYTVRNWNGQTAGNQTSGYDARIAPWITVTPKREGTVTLTVKCYYQGWNMNASPQHSPTTTKLSEETLTIVVSYPTDKLHVRNEIPESGCLVPTGLADTAGVTYTWTRSDNVAIRLEALNADGSVNVAKDRGGIINDSTKDLGSSDPIVYTVTATLPDGTTQTATYEVLYGNEILNPSFEVPDDAKANWAPPWGGTYGYITNGVPGVHWKTTSPGDEHNIGRDLEFGSASSPHGATPAHGSQYVELNAENYGALYQDILTSPGATLTWEFSHAARSGADKNQMYIVMAATENAQSVVDLATITALIQAAGGPNDASNPTHIPSSGEGYEFEYNGGTYRIWYNDANSGVGVWETVSGAYTVPDGQYLTRLFFVSNPLYLNQDKTMGNLIDSVSAGEFMSYTVEYYETNKLASDMTETGTDVSAYTSVSLVNLQHFLDKYEYPFKILVNGKTYSGTVADLQRGLYITDYGEKTGSSVDAKYDDYEIVVQIYFQVPNVRVTKNVIISDWDTLSATKKQELLNAGLNAEFQMQNDNDSDDKYTASVSITQQGTDGSLSASTSFPINQAVYGKPYTVTETSATKIEGYEVITTVTGNTFTLDETDGPHVVNVTITNTYYPVGSLMVSKFVSKGLNENAVIDGNKAFAFTVTLGSVPDAQNGPYPYTIKNYTSGATPAASDTVAVTGFLPISADGTLTFTLQHNQYIVIDDLPVTAYTVAEADYTAEGYLAADITGGTGSITRGNMAEVTCYNELEVFPGDLQITKTVKDNSTHEGAPKQAFTFTVTLNNLGAGYEGKQYTVVYSCDTSKGTLSGDQTTYTLNGDSAVHTLVQTVTLTEEWESYQFQLELYDGLTATIKELPSSGYYIEEDDYSSDNFGTSWQGNQTGIVGGQKVNGTVPVASVTCVNTYPVTSGVIEITKVVQKMYERDVLPGDTFTFVITPADGINLNGVYGMTVGGTTTTLQAVNNQLEVQISFTAEELAALGLNDSYQKVLQITDLPMGSYTVTEAEDADYEQISRTKTVAVGSTAGQAVFVNKYKRHLGRLTISKTVVGGSADDTFIFHIKGTDANNSYIDMDVTITGSNRITIYDLPLGNYTVTEDTDWSWRYSTDSASASGNLTVDSPDATASFTNTYTVNRWLSYTANMPNVFGKKENEQEGG